MKNKTQNYLGNRILSHYETARQILEGGMPIPRMAIVYPTYQCNLGCSYCEYQEDNSSIQMMMSRDELFRVIDEISALGVRGIEFCGGGEPTLHADLADAIVYAKQKNLTIGLLTNGILLTDDLLETVVDNLHYVRISLDASTKETYNKIKKPGYDTCFDDVISNIKSMLKKRNERGTKLTVSLKYLISKQNIDELYKAADFASALGVDSLQFKGARIYSGALTAGEEKDIQPIIDDIKKQYAPFPILGGVIKSTLKKKCWLSPIQVTIDALGEVFICCYFRHRKETHSFGNIFKHSLKEIWYSKKHQETIDNIKQDECNVLDCRFHHYNDVMSTLMIENKGELEFI